MKARTMINHQLSMINKIQNAMLFFAPLCKGRDPKDRGVFSGQMQNPPVPQSGTTPFAKGGRTPSLFEKEGVGGRFSFLSLRGVCIFIPSPMWEGNLPRGIQQSWNLFHWGEGRGQKHTPTSFLPHQMGRMKNGDCFVSFAMTLQKILHYNVLYYNMLSWLPFGRGDGRRPKGFCSKKSPLPCKIAPLRGISQGESPFAKGGRIHSVIPAKTGIQ